MQQHQQNKQQQQQQQQQQPRRVKEQARRAANTQQIERVQPENDDTNFTLEPQWQQSAQQQQQAEQRRHQVNHSPLPPVEADKKEIATDWQLERKYTLKEVQQHNSLDDCWMVIFDKVYDITDFVFEHPGGDFILLEYAGRDATHPFLSSRHGSSAYKMLDKYWIGILVDEELYYSNHSSYCSVYSNLSWRSTPTLDVAAGRDSPPDNAMK